MRPFYTALADKLEKHFRVDARYFLSGGFWLGVGQITTVGFGLITTVLFANFLSATDYGIYKYLIGLAALFSVFSLSGLGQSIIQTAAQKYDSFYRETLRINFLYSIPISIIAGTASLYYFWNENIVLSLGCLFIACIQPFIGVFQFTPAYLTGKQQFKETTILQTIKIIFSSAALLAVLYFTTNIIVLFAAYLVIQLILNLLSYWFYAPESAGPTPAALLQEYVSYAKHTSVRNVISNIAYRLDSIIIFTQLGAVELAIYTIANIVPEQIKGTFKSISTLILPRYAQQENVSLAKKSMPKRSTQLFFIYTAITIVYIALSPFLYELLFPKYEDISIYTQLIALSFPAAIATLPYSLLQAQRKDRELHMFNIQSSVLLIVLTVTLIPFFGITGAIIAKIISRYSNLFLSFFYLRSIGD
jgi:O-antigen/teichoic acid export membrane protein